MNNIRKGFETDINNVFKQFLSRSSRKATCFKCCLSSSAQALFSLKVVVLFIHLKYMQSIWPFPDTLLAS